MKRLPHFEIHQPASAGEAAEALRQFDGTATLYAGGTELLLAMKEMVLAYEHLIDVKTIPELHGISLEDGMIRIGATTTHAEVQQSELVRTHVPWLAETAARIANPRVRSTGTVGGNLAFAEPHSDLATLLMCMDASCVATNGDETRQIPIGDFIAGPYETVLDDEVLIAVILPTTQARRGAYAKFQVHERPMIGVAAILDLDASGENVVASRLAVGSVSPVPLRASAAEGALVGPVADMWSALPDAAAHLVAVAQITDDEIGSRDYKEHLVGVMLSRALSSALGTSVSAGAQ